MFLKGTGSQLAASFFTMQLEKLLVNEKKPQLHVILTCLPSTVSNITSHKSELWKTVLIQSSSSLSMHVSFCIILACYLYQLLTFWAVISMLHSILIFIKFCDTAATFGVTAPCRVEKQSTLYNTLGELYFLEGHYFCYHVVMTEGYVG